MIVESTSLELFGIVCDCVPGVLHGEPEDVLQGGQGGVVADFLLEPFDDSFDVVGFVGFLLAIATLFIGVVLVKAEVKILQGSTFRLRLPGPWLPVRPPRCLCSPRSCQAIPWFDMC